MDSGEITNGTAATNATRYHYISCFSFNFWFKGHYNFWGSPGYDVKLQYWNGSTWVTAAEETSLCDEIREWEVNRNSGSYIYVNQPTHLWRVSVRHFSGNNVDAARRMRIWCHGIGETPSGVWDASVKGKKITCIPTTTNLGITAQWSTGHSTSYTPSQLPALYNTAQFAGNPILNSIARCRLAPAI
jgi:hypothetical protein